jgi:hypothetical protein
MALDDIMIFCALKFAPPLDKNTIMSQAEADYGPYGPQAGPKNHHWVLVFLCITIMLIFASVVANEVGAPLAVTAPLGCAAGICGFILFVLLLFTSMLLVAGLVLVAAVVGGVYAAVTKSV